MKYNLGGKYDSKIGRGLWAICRCYCKWGYPQNGSGGYYLDSIRMVLEIAGVAALMWLLPLGLTPTKKLMVKLMERWKNIDI